MKRYVRLVLLLGALLVPVSDLGAQTRWWDGAWRCRRILDTFPPKLTSYTGSDVAYFEVYGQGNLKPDGSDIRVVADGRVLHHKLINLTTTGIARILFELLPGVDTCEIYYGNPQAPAPEAGWEPQRGLILQTLPYTAGGYNNWAQAEETLRRAGPPFGAGPVDRVFHGHNPFGPSQRFISIYEGSLYCPVAGTYTFATTSGNASFLFINGQRVVDWPGQHGPVGDARHNREVALEAGLARLRYVGIFTGGQPASVAAWKLPGSQNFEVIPKSAFPPLAITSQRVLEIKGQRLAPDFRVDYAGEATLTPEGDRYLVKVHFENTSPQEAKLTYQPSWDFGDGTTSREMSPTHIYLAPATYTVTLTLAGAGRYEASQPIEVSEDWDAQVAQRIEDRSAYYDQLRKYDVSALAPASLANLIEYFLAMGKPDDALRAGEALLAPASAASAASSAPSASPARPQRASTSDASVLRAAHLLEEVLLPPGFPPGSKRDPQRTLRLYSAAEGRVADTRTKAELALAQGDVLFEELRKLDEARADYDKVLKDYRRPENSLEARRAYFGLGRVARWQGNRTEADQWFSKAQAIPVGEGSAEKLVVRRSAWARAVEDALKREEPEVSADAWQQLVTWAWYYPEDLLAGHHTLLLARLLLKQKAPQRAAEELEALVKVNPESQFADQALWTLVDAYLALGKRPEAVSALDRLARDYPASGLIPKLEARRRQVETAVLR